MAGKAWRGKNMRQLVTVFIVGMQTGEMNAGAQQASSYIPSFTQFGSYVIG